MVSCTARHATPMLTLVRQVMLPCTIRRQLKYLCIPSLYTLVLTIQECWIIDGNETPWLDELHFTTQGQQFEGQRQLAIQSRCSFQKYKNVSKSSKYFFGNRYSDLFNKSFTLYEVSMLVSLRISLIAWFPVRMYIIPSAMQNNNKPPNHLT